VGKADVHQGWIAEAVVLASARILPDRLMAYIEADISLQDDAFAAQIRVRAVNSPSPGLRTYAPTAMLAFFCTAA